MGRSAKGKRGKRRRPPAKRPERARAASDGAEGQRGELGLSDAFRDWLAHNLMRGVPAERLVDDLVRDAEVPREIAAREVEAMASSPLLPICARYARWSRSLELVLELERNVERAAQRRGADSDAAQDDEPQAPLDRLATVDAATFFSRYYAAGRPLVLTEATRGWPALERWTPQWLAETLAEVELDVCVGRSADATPDLNFEAHTERLLVPEFVRRVLEAGESNDLYLIANNHATKRPELAVLLQDIVVDEALFDRARIAGASSLWLGPAGTITPLHHDTSNILFCQIYGRKRVHLAPPTDLPLLRRLEGFYVQMGEHDAERALEQAARGEGPLAAARVRSVELGPGDALFIPAGWFHAVRALDVSISFSLLCFRRPNNFDWYRPGAPAL